MTGYDRFGERLDDDEPVSDNTTGKVWIKRIRDQLSDDQPIDTNSNGDGRDN